MRKLYFVPVLVLLAFSISTAFSQSLFYTSSGSFLVPADVDSVTIEMVGAGGSGGGNGGGGGGGGGYAKGNFHVVFPGSHDITIGTGGSGTATSITGFAITATAGANGTIVPNPSIGGGGAGGVGSGGTTNRTGGTGGGGFWTYFGGGGGGAAGSVSNGNIGGNTIAWTGVCLTPGGAFGPSGGAPGGNGGKGAGFTDPSCNVSNPAGNGDNYGGGGGGGNGNGGNPGTGAGGYCIISWEVISGNNAVALKDNVRICGNPFTDKINILSPNDNDIYELLNSIGQTIWSGKNIEKEDFSDLSQGVYFLCVQNPNSIQTVKLIKQ